MWVQVCACHDQCVEVQGQLPGAGFPLPWVSGIYHRSLSLWSGCLYLLSHLDGQLCLFYLSTSLGTICSLPDNSNLRKCSLLKLKDIPEEHSTSTLILDEKTSRFRCQHLLWSCGNKVYKLLEWTVSSGVQNYPWSLDLHKTALYGIVRINNHLVNKSSREPQWQRCHR